VEISVKVAASLEEVSSKIPEADILIAERSGRSRVIGISPDAKKEIDGPQ
jgi:hypothetical protein